MHRSVPYLLSVLLLSALIVLTACSKAPETLKTAKSSTTTAANSNSNSSDLVDINSASKTQLISLPGIGESHAQQIIDGRPYREKSELVRRNIISEKTYEMISDKVIAHQR